MMLQLDHNPLFFFLIFFRVSPNSSKPSETIYYQFEEISDLDKNQRSCLLLCEGRI